MIFLRILRVFALGSFGAGFAVWIMLVSVHNPAHFETLSVYLVAGGLAAAIFADRFIPKP